MAVVRDHHWLKHLYTPDAACVDAICLTLGGYDEQCK